MDRRQVAKQYVPGQAGGQFRGPRHAQDYWANNLGHRNRLRAGDLCRYAENAAHSQVPSMQVPLVQAPSIKGDRLNAKPMRTEVPVRVIGPTRVT